MTEQFTYPEKNELTTSEYQDKKLDEVYLWMKEWKYFLQNSKSGAQLSNGSFYVKTWDWKDFLLNIKNWVVYEESNRLSQDFKIEWDNIIYWNWEKYIQVTIESEYEKENIISFFDDPFTFNENNESIDIEKALKYLSIFKKNLKNKEILDYIFFELNTQIAKNELNLTEIIEIIHNNNISLSEKEISNLLTWLYSKASNEELINLIDEYPEIIFKNKQSIQMIYSRTSYNYTDSSNDLLIKMYDTERVLTMKFIKDNVSNNSNIVSFINYVYDNWSEEDIDILKTNKLTGRFRWSILKDGYNYSSSDFN